MSLCDTTIIPAVVSWEHMQRYVPTIIEWAQRTYELPDRIFAYGHRRQVPL